MTWGFAKRLREKLGWASSCRLRNALLDRMDRKSKTKLLRKWLQVLDSREISGAPGETRTPDPLVRSRSIYFAKSCQRSGYSSEFSKLGQIPANYFLFPSLLFAAFLPPFSALCVTFS